MRIKEDIPGIAYNVAEPIAGIYQYHFYAFPKPGISIYKGGKLNLHIGHASFIFIHYSLVTSPIKDTCSRHVV
jgi:hypothetical protein